MSRRSSKFVVVALAAFITCIVCTGTAYAYRKTTISGATLNSGATAGTISLTSTAIVGGGQLSPGGASAPVTITVTNPAGSKTMPLVSATATFSVNGSPTPKGACGITSLSWATTTSLPVTATAGGASVPITGNVTMAIGAEDGCQGAAFTASVTVTGKTS
jgi:hypothetical protein